MRVLVTGCQGQVGQCLVSRLRHSVELLAVDRNQLDITNKLAVHNVVSNFRPDFIINAAAYTAVDKAEENIELAYAVNQDGPDYLAEAASQLGATILHISTDYVFSGEGDVAYSENDPTQPASIYGKSKLAGEEAVRTNTHKHIILRTAWVFGEEGNNFVKTMLRLGKSRTELSIVNDQRGGPTYAGDIADTLISIIQKLSEEKDQLLYGTYHYSGYPNVSWYEFAEAIFRTAEQLNLQKSPTLHAITSEQYPTPAIRPKNSVLNNTKIREAFAIEPSNWRKALSRLEEFNIKL